VDGPENTQSLLVLRKLTRAIASAQRTKLTEHLAAMTPLLRPETVFGKLIQGAQKDLMVKSDQALQELRTLYNSVAPAPPFNLRPDVAPPFDLGGLSLEATPVAYIHLATSGSSTRKITIRCPLVWTLSYKGYTLPMFQQLLQSESRPASDVQRFLVATLALDVVLKLQPGVMGLLTSLRLPVTTVREAEFGQLPITRIGVGIGTRRPSDAVITESAELTGVDSFEEIVRIEDIHELRDPLRDKLLEIAKQHAPELVAN
jgi:hypothetical protein